MAYFCQMKQFLKKSLKNNVSLELGMKRPLAKVSVG